MQPIRRRVALILIGLIGLAPIASGETARQEDQATSPPALQEAFKDAFKVGAALNRRQYSGQDAKGTALAIAQFNSISPENDLKWENIHPRSGPDGYDFAAADRYVEFGEKHGMFIVGHTLVWHEQTPKWVFQGEDGGPATREALLERMRDHIHTVAGRYKGRIHSWDVVNEAVADNGSLRDTPWLRIIGEDYIAKAFEYAREADPAAQLRYNDYALEKPAKRQGVIALVRKLQAQGVPIDGVGSQTHANLGWPSAEELDEALTELTGLGLPIAITELDVAGSRNLQQVQSADVAQNPGANADQNLVDDHTQRQVKQYGDFFRIFMKHRDAIELVTFWGVTDANSWRRQGQPLLFDGQWRPKPAFDAVIAESKK
jgi:endo-1,4-beta-xylanase